MAFTHVLGPAGIGASLQGARDSNPLLRGQIEILLCVPAVGFTKTPALLDDPFHEKILTAQGEIRKKESGGLGTEVGGWRSEDRGRKTEESEEIRRSRTAGGLDSWARFANSRNERPLGHEEKITYKKNSDKEINNEEINNEEIGGEEVDEEKIDAAESGNHEIGSSETAYEKIDIDDHHGRSARLRGRAA